MKWKIEKCLNCIYTANNYCAIVHPQNETQEETEKKTSPVVKRS